MRGFWDFVKDVLDAYGPEDNLRVRAYTRGTLPELEYELRGRLAQAMHLFPSINLEELFSSKLKDLRQAIDNEQMTDSFVRRYMMENEKVLPDKVRMKRTLARVALDFLNERHQDIEQLPKNDRLWAHALGREAEKILGNVIDRHA